MTFRSCLRSVKAKKFNKKVYGFDIETYDDNKEFLCASIYGDDYQRTYWTRKELIDDLKSKKFYDSFIVATNLAFDFFGLFWRNIDLQYFDTLFRGSDLIYAKTFVNSKGFSRTSGQKEHDKHWSLTFIDTTNYARISVEKLGKIIGLPKLDKPSFLGKKPQTLEEIDIMVKYNMRDSEVSQKFIKFLFKSFEEFGCTPKLTISSTAMNLFKSKYLGDKRYYLMPEDYIKDMFNAYYGGRTECIARGSFGPNHFYYDFTSLYPSVMKDIDLPDPNYVRTNTIDSIDYIMRYEGVSHVDVYCPEMMYPLLPYRKGKTMFPTGTFTGWYCNNELREAIKLGYKILKVHHNYWFSKTCKPFKNFVIDMFERRRVFKEQNNPMEQVAKLFMNSLSGKFGQKYEDKDNWIPVGCSIEKLEIFKSFERIDCMYRVKQDGQPSSFCIPVWIAYITAQGRILLHDKMVKLKAKYCDTDSIVTDIEDPSATGELGHLKLEDKIKFGVWYRPKMYTYTNYDNKNCVKIKGVGRQLNQDELLGLYKNPIVSYKKFTKFKEACRRGLIPNEIRDVCKRIGFMDDKRSWNSEFNPDVLEWSQPVCLIDGLTRIEREELQQKAIEDYAKKQVENEKLFINSDLFDKGSAGSDDKSGRLLYESERGSWRD